MKNLEVPLCTPSTELSFYMPVEETRSDMPKPSWAAVLNAEVRIRSGTVPQVQVVDVKENPRSNVEDCLKDRRIGDEAKDGVKKLVTEEIKTLVAESLDTILRNSYNKAWSGIRSVEYNVRKQLLLDSLREEVIAETLEPHVRKYFDNDAAADRLSKKLLTSRAFVVPIATLVRHRTDSAIACQNTVIGRESKDEPLSARAAHEDIFEIQSSR